MTKLEKENRINEAYKRLLPFRGKQIAACIKHVSSSGMSRRIEFYTEGFRLIGRDIAELLDYRYDIDKGGLSVGGCGMDMVFSVLSNLNYKMAQMDTGKQLQQLQNKKGGYTVNGKHYERIYDNYFIDADHYQLL